MSSSLTSISKTLDRMSDIQTDTRLLEERFNHMDENLRESFERVYKKIEEEENARQWVVRVIVGSVLLGVMYHLIPNLH